MVTCDGKENIPKKLKPLGYTDADIKQRGLGKDCQVEASNNDLHTCVLLGKDGSKALTPAPYILCPPCLTRYKNEKEVTTYSG